MKLKHDKRSLRLFLALILSCWAFSARAQESVEAPDELEAESDEEVFELSPFRVTTADDRGYLSTNAVSGTSLNMLIRDLPVPLEVINQEFLEDLQATDLDEAVAYSAGVFTQTFSNGSGANSSGSAETSPSARVSVNDPFANSLSIRGYSVPNQQRFGFRVGGIAVGEGFAVLIGGSTDTAASERIEVVRGPASLLYGVNVLSGVVNIQPKRPLAEEKYSFSLNVGSYGYQRATADFTGPLIEGKLNYRAIIVDDEREHWTDFRTDSSDFYLGQLEWTPWRKTTVLAEFQYANVRRQGTGSQYFVDRSGGSNTNTLDFRNQFGEYVQFGREDLSPLMDRDESDPNDVWLIRKTNPLAPYDPGNLGDDYRITGPDTYFERREINAMLLVQSEIIENLNVELGGYFTRFNQDEFRISTGVFTDIDSEILVSDTAPLLPTPTRANLWVRHPEVNALLGGVVPDRLPRQAYGLDDVVGFSISLDDVPNGQPTEINGLTSGGLGEVFIVPDRSRRASNPGTDWNRPNSKFARYWWTQEPTRAESLQLRMRLAYNFETAMPFFEDQSITHTFTGGVQYTHDTVEVVTGNPDLEEILTFGSLERLEGRNFSLGRLGSDPYVLRKSVFDYTPIRYNGEPVVSPGRVSVSSVGLGSALLNYVNDGRESEGEIVGHNIARSGWREIEAEYQGIYGIYHSKFWNDRANLILGMRQDEYDVSETERIRLLDGNPNVDPNVSSTLTDEYFGSSQFAVLPYTIDGTKQYTRDRWIDSLPDALNEEIQREMNLMLYGSSIEELEGIGPQGTQRDFFEETQSFVTKTAAFSFSITDDLSFYTTYSEGVFPNQGLLDGNDRPIEAEQTVGREVGLKFDFFDGKISGTMSFYRINRENASWNFSRAPAPRGWLGGRLGDSPEQALARGSVGDFDAVFATTGAGVKATVMTDPTVYGVPEERLQKYSYGIHRDFFEDAYVSAYGEERVLEAFGETGFPNTFNLKVLNDSVGSEDLFNFLGLNDFSVGGSSENRGVVKTYVYVDVSEDFEPGKHVDENTGIDVGLMLQEAFDNALAAKEFDGFRIYYQNNARNAQFGGGNNPSNSTGALVTFQEETTGVDGQIILSPTDSYQLLFTYSHQNREVVGNGFNLAELIDPQTGQKVPGTKYDRWVAVLGAENFTDPTDPTTFTGEGINGLDLSFVPKWNFSLWNKYSFKEGRLKGLELAGGARYFGEAPTSVAIGGAALSENEFPTPPTKERIQFDASLSYRFTFMDARWRIALKVNNLLNDREEVNTVQYSDPGGPLETLNRRSRNLYAPRTWRLSANMGF